MLDCVYFYPKQSPSIKQVERDPKIDDYKSLKQAWNTSDKKSAAIQRYEFTMSYCV